MSLTGCFTRAKGSKYFPRYTRSCSKYHIVCSLSWCSFWPKWLLSANKVLPVKIAPQHTLHVSLPFTNFLALCDPCFYLRNFWFSYGARYYETVVQNVKEECCTSRWGQYVAIGDVDVRLQVTAPPAKSRGAQRRQWWRANATITTD